VWKKLARVLFVPVEHDAPRFEDRRLGAPLLWVPSAAERALLEADWELLAGLIGEGELGQITAHLGQALQVRPKAAHARARRLGPASDGGIGWTLPRGFYLRARFTEGVLRRLLVAG
jgi:DNA mismatch repair protein MutH